MSDTIFAVEKGWFAGYGDGSSHPDEVMTTEQIAYVMEQLRVTHLWRLGHRPRSRTQGPATL